MRSKGPSPWKAAAAPPGAPFGAKTEEYQEWILLEPNLEVLPDAGQLYVLFEWWDGTLPFIKGLVMETAKTRSGLWAELSASALRSWRIGEAVQTAIDFSRAPFGWDDHTDILERPFVKRLRQMQLGERVVVDAEFLEEIRTLYYIAIETRLPRAVSLVAEWTGRPISTVSGWIRRAEKAHRD